MRSLVEQTLKDIGYYSPDAANLILGTIAQESAYGKYRRQLGDGPALGICQMEPNTFHDIVFNYLFHRKWVADIIMEVCGVTEFNPSDLETNDKLAICFCRCHYLRCKEEIPSMVEGYAELWKKRYNTINGSGTTQEFIDNYQKYVAPDLI